jgi:exonuclease SbcD
MVYRFAHMSDCHIGAWRDPVLKELNIRAFEMAADRCIEEKVDFIIIAGDFFDVNIPDLESVQRATEKLRQVKDAGIAAYIIYGSHDYSATRISMINILESAGLFRKVMEPEVLDDNRITLAVFTDEKTGAKITGMSGRALSLEKTYFEMLDHESFAGLDGFKIFVFHSAINEFRPRDLTHATSMPLSLLPPGFSYYAGGHVHSRSENRYADGLVVYPGCTFGTDSRDLERTSQKEKRGFYIIEFENARVRKLDFIEISPCEIISKTIDAERKTAAQVQSALDEYVSSINASNKVVLIKLQGTLSAGKPSDVDTNSARELLKKNGAITVNISKFGLGTQEVTKIAVMGETKEQIEEKLFKERLGAFKLDPSIKDQKVRNFVSKLLVGDGGTNLAKDLLSVLKNDQKDNESKALFEERMVSEAVTRLKVSELE